MTTYHVTIPPVGDFSGLALVLQTNGEPAAVVALREYNQARRDNGLRPVSFVPVGTKYQVKP